MGQSAGPRGLVRAPLLVTALAAGLLLASVPARAADPAMDVDSLWNQPEAISVSSGWYFVQAGWDQAARAAERDPARRSLAELAQANTDLLNAYSLLAEARTDPDPRPVPLVDPAIASLYGTVTGVKVRAPLGSLFAWFNQAMLNFEGRGSTQDIAKSLLRDFAQRQRAADEGLLQRADLDDAWAANSLRQQAMLAKLQALAAAEGPDGAAVAALVTDAEHQRQDLLKHHRGRHDGGHANGQAHGDGHEQQRP